MVELIAYMLAVLTVASTILVVTNGLMNAVLSFLKGRNDWTR